MTQVSKYPLRKEIEKRVYEVLMESIASARTRNSVESFVNDLFSPAEQLMIAKRLSIALLLLKKYNQRTIARWLNVSLATVNKVSRVLQRKNGGYETVIGSILKKEEFRALIEKIDDSLADMFPPLHRNWSHWRKKRWEEKMARHKPF